MYGERAWPNQKPSSCWGLPVPCELSLKELVLSVRNTIRRSANRFIYALALSMISDLIATQFRADLMTLRPSARSRAPHPFSRHRSTIHLLQHDQDPYQEMT